MAAVRISTVNRRIDGNNRLSHSSSKTVSALGTRAEHTTVNVIEERKLINAGENHEKHH